MNVWCYGFIRIHEDEEGHMRFKDNETTTFDRCFLLLNPFRPFFIFPWQKKNYIFVARTNDGDDPLLPTTQRICLLLLKANFRFTQVHILTVVFINGEVTLSHFFRKGDYIFPKESLSGYPTITFCNDGQLLYLENDYASFDNMLSHLRHVYSWRVDRLGMFCYHCSMIAK